jgi:Flp pilus assembly protein CpaB
VASKRTLILIVAIVLGALSAYSLYSYVNGIEDRALADSTPVTVYVIAADIPANTTGDEALAQRLIRQDSIPQEFKPSTAVTDENVLKGKVADVNLVAGQVLVEGMFVNPIEAGVSTWSGRLEANEVACAVSLDEVRAVGGVLTAQDKVSVLIVEETQQDPESDSAPAVVTDEQGEESATYPLFPPYVGTGQWLYHNLEILSVGNIGLTEAQATDGTAVTSSSGLITFKAPADACARIAVSKNFIYLMLEPQNYEAPENLVPINPVNVLDKPNMTPAETDETNPLPEPPSGLDTIVNP